MYVEKYHAHIVIRSKSRNTSSLGPGLKLSQLHSARYVLTNDEEKLTYPLRLRVLKSRVDISKTDFYQHLLTEYPSIECVGESMNAHLLIHDDFDIIKFLLLYNE